MAKRRSDFQLSRSPQSTFHAVAHSVQKASGSIAEAARRWTDPREQLLRRRRRARRQVSRFGSATAVSAIASVAAAVGSMPEWTVVTGGGIAAVFAVPAALSIRRLRRLTATPLPRAAHRESLLPARTSAAYASMARLRGNEVGLHQIVEVLSRSNLIAPEVLDSAEATALSAATALHDVSEDVMSMERACVSSPTAAQHLRPSIERAAQQLDAGVDQYENLVEAAAKLTSPLHAMSSAVLNSRRAELQSASDRLHGWATALEELGDIAGRFQ